MVEEGVLKRIRKVKLLEEQNRRLRYLAKEECQKLIKHCNAHLRPIVVTAINTGMRKSEILGLKWDNVDLRHGFILLDVTKNGERREVPINQTLREALETLRRGTKDSLPGWISPGCFMMPRPATIILISGRLSGWPVSGLGSKISGFTICDIPSPVIWSWPGWISPLSKNSWATRPYHDAAVCSPGPQP